MSKAAKASGQVPSAPAEMPFEEALHKLETVVESMESGDLPLEALLARFEEGTRLAQVCQNRLSEAEIKIQQLEKTAGGDLQLKPMPLPEAETD